MSRLAAFALLLAAAPAAAVDEVFLTDGTRLAGAIESMSRDEVTVKSRIGGPKTAPADEIDHVEFDGQPAKLNIARGAVAGGSYASALETLREIRGDAAGNKDLLAEIDYLTAAALAGQAGGGGEALQAATDALQKFVDTQRKHYRFFPATMLLARTQAAAGDYGAAKANYRAVEGSKFRSLKMAAKVGLGDAEFAAGNADAAGRLYDEVAGMNASKSAEVSEKLAARLGQAKVAVGREDYDQAIQTLSDVIEETTAADTRVQAEAYLRQGDAYAAQGTKLKEAVMAYLHVDVVPSLAKDGALHAEALYRLSQLWPAAGRPARGAEAAAKLQQMYPKSEWAKKVGG